MKGQEIKARLRKFEREAEPFKVKVPRRIWIVSASGKDEEEADAKLAERISNIRAGKEAHPTDARPYKEDDAFMSIKVIELNDGEKLDVESMFHSILKGERSGRPGGNGSSPEPEDPGQTLPEVDNKAADEIKKLEARIEEIDNLLEEKEDDDS